MQTSASRYQKINCNQQAVQSDVHAALWKMCKWHGFDAGEKYRNIRASSNTLVYAVLVAAYVRRFAAACCRRSHRTIQLAAIFPGRYFPTGHCDSINLCPHSL